MTRKRRRFAASSFGAALGIALGVALAPAPAAAQAEGAGPTVVGLPLDEVPVGSWAEYKLRGSGRPTQQIRHALVAKEAGAFALESASQSARGARTITRALLAADPTAEGGVKRIVVQRGSGEPVEVPAGPHVGGSEGEREGRARGLGRRFLKPDPRQRIGAETVTVPAGTFEAQRYRYASARGGVIDFWIAPGAGPLGLVKLQMGRPSASPGRRGSGVNTLELVARGSGAKPEITKPPKPLDPETRRSFWGGGTGRRFAHPSGAPPPAKSRAAPEPPDPAKSK